MTLWLLASCFCGISTSGSCCVSMTLLPALGILSSYWVTLSNLKVKAYCILYCLVWLSLGHLLFSEGRQRGSGSGQWGVELGELEGGEPVIKVYCMRVESIFS